ncbi:serine/threonine transporter SstT [Planctomycetales bacterium]|nr:serine/threonine transporter SstT [Planctomycetales bacterium]
MWQRLWHLNLVWQIIIGMFAGVALALLAPAVALRAGFLGELFVGALKAVAPVLIFILVVVALATKEIAVKTGMKPIIIMYFAGMLLAAVVAVLFSFAFPVTLPLGDFSSTDAATTAATAPVNVFDVLKNVLRMAIDNPLHAIASANFIGVLAWSIGIGIALHHYASATTKTLLKEVNATALKLVSFVIRLAPLGIFGLVAATVATTGLSAFAQYGRLLAVLVGAMLISLLIVTPLIMYLKSRRNPYPLIFVCLKESALPAFFTRSSSANTPINLALCKKMALSEATYSISIPLGSVVNMSGAAVTITVFALAAAWTVGLPVGFGAALILCVVATLGACGTSGVAGGSLLLIPLACGLFQIDGEIASQVMAIGFLVGVVQDSCETALNSSTDVMFTAAASPTPPKLDF